jgi:hypothetical protein
MDGDAVKGGEKSSGQPQPSRQTCESTSAATPKGAGTYLADLAGVRPWLTKTLSLGGVKVKRSTPLARWLQPDSISFRSPSTGTRTDALRRHFHLGVSYIGSIVSRHRIEAYVLDAHGLVAYSFERLRWNEQEMVERAAELSSQPEATLPRPTTWHHLAGFRRQRSRWSALLHLLPALALAFLPKCPICWATYLSACGLAGLELVVRLPWIQPLLITALLVNVVSAGLRARATGRWTGACLVGAGALATIGSLFGAPVGGWGLVLTLAGSLLSAMDRDRQSVRSLSSQSAH